MLIPISAPSPNSPPSLNRVLTFTITAGDFIDLDAGQVSLASPIGQGLLGGAKGEEVTVQLPRGNRRYRILDLTTLPQQLEESKEHGD